MKFAKKYIYNHQSPKLCSLSIPLHSIIKWLFVIAFLVLSQSFSPGNYPLFAEENSDVKKSFSSVRTIRVEVFEKLPGNVNLPFFKETRETLQAMGFKVVNAGGQPSDCALTISAEGGVMGRQYDYQVSLKTGKLEQKKQFRYTGWYLKGDISLKIPGQPVIQEKFAKRRDPPERVTAPDPGGLTREWAAKKIPDLFRDSYPDALVALLTRVLYPDKIQNLLLSDTVSQKLKGSLFKAIGNQKDRSFISILLPLLKHRDSWIRGRTAWVLGDFGDRSVVTPLLPLLQDSHFEVRRYAAYSLRTIKWEPKSKHNKIYYLIALGKWDEIVKLGNESRKAVEDILEGKYISAPRAAAAETLGRIGNPASARVLISVLEGEEPVEKGYIRVGSPVKRQVIIALGKLADPTAVPSIVKGLKDFDPKTRRTAAETLGKFKHASATPALKEALAEKDKAVFPAVVNALEQMGTPESLNALITCLARFNELKKDYNWTDPILDALAKNGTPIAIKGLVELLKIQELRFSHSLILKIEKSGNLAFVDPLVGIIDQAPPSTQQYIARALGKLGDRKAIPTLVKFFRMEGSRARDEAAKALIKLGWKPETREDQTLLKVLSGTPLPKEIPGDASLDAILTALKDPADTTREKAAISLGELKNPGAVPHLIQALSDEDVGVKRSTLLSLGKIGDPAAVKPVLDVLNLWRSDEYKNKFYRDQICAAAAAALGMLGDPSAIESLTPLLSFEDKYARIAAIKALGKLEAEGAVKKIASIAKEETNSLLLIEAAIQTLSEFDSQEAQNHLLELLTAYASRKRKEAASVLMNKIDDPRVTQPLVRALCRDNRKALLPFMNNPQKKSLVKQVAFEDDGERCSTPSNRCFK